MRTIQFEASGYTFTVGGSLVTKVCPVCGVPYAMPEEFDEWCQKSPRRNFYCPNGHQLHYPGKTEAEKLRDQLAQERDWSARLAADRDQIEASLRATKGVVTRMKNRASAGVCPCCSRTFQQLTRHMKAKHPGYVERVPGHLPRDLSPRRAAHRAHVDALLAFLSDGPRRWIEIRDHLGISSGQMGPLLSRLMESGEVDRPARGLYRRRPS